MSKMQNQRAWCRTNVHGVERNQRYKDTVQELNQLHGFKVDDWFLSSGRCGEIKVHGPYKTADEACKAATAKYGVTKLLSPLLIF
ncbi:TPA: hypothetical protein ACVOYJ_004763 [Vibrio diabolicus]